LTIEVELYRVRGSTLIGAITGDSDDLRGLLAVLESKAPKLFEDMQRVLSAKPEKPVPPPEPPPPPPEPPPPPKPVPNFAADEPYEPPVALGDKDEGGDSKEKEDSDKSAFSLGLRAGLNSSNLRTSEFAYSNPAMGFQLGLVLDMAVSKRFHLQPGLMYIQKGAEDYGTHYIEVPLLLSLKFSAFRINAGPYFGICVSKPSDYVEVIDMGISSGLGFDIGKFYIGMFYDFGLADVINVRNYEIYNKTFGFNWGVNL
jgi:hypothetical protein